MSRNLTQYNEQTIIRAAKGGLHERRIAKTQGVSVEQVRAVIAAYERRHGPLIMRGRKKRAKKGPAGR